MLVGLGIVAVQKAYASNPCGTSGLQDPPIWVEDCAHPQRSSSVGYWLPYCGPGNIYRQFDRCANESFYQKQQQRIGLFSNARWIWQFGHDGDFGIPDISSANGGSTTDLSGFVNVIRRDLYDSLPAGFGYLYLVGKAPKSCGETNRNGPDGVFYNELMWCEIDVSAALGASQIINNMMGIGADNPAFNTDAGGAAFYQAICGNLNGFSSVATTNDRRLNGIGIARCLFPKWKQLVDYYASQPVNSPNGWVDWNNTADLSSCRTDAVVYRNVIGFNVADPNSLDTGSYINCSVDTVSRYIVFYNPGGVPAFRINKNCGNLTGPLAPLVVNGEFHITPQPGAVTLSPSAENVSSASFPSSYSVDADMSGTSLSSTITRTFYIAPYGGGANFTLGTKTDNISGNQLTAGSHSLSTETINNITTLYPGLKTGDQVCQIMKIDPAEGKYNFHTNTANGTSSTTSTPSCQPINDQPYAKFFGGDVFAGGGFNDGPDGGFGCTNNIGGIYLLNTGSDPNVGPSAQFAATALGPINMLSTANLGGASAYGKPPNGLTFANFPISPPPPAKPTSGTFGKGQCITNYWANSATVANEPGIGPTLNALNTLSSGSHRYNGNLTIKPNTLDDGDQIVLYVDGDVRIEGNINYSANFKSTSNLTNENQIPTFILVAKGNIYIDPGVTELNGIYIAQDLGDTAKGKIYTCSNGFAPYAVPVDAITSGPFMPSNACNSRLTVYGTFVARTVKFTRTAGSLRNSIPNEKYTDSPGRAAETFVMSPEMYVGSAKVCGLIPGICQPGSYDALTSLPPVL